MVGYGRKVHGREGYIWLIPGLCVKVKKSVIIPAYHRRQGAWIQMTGA